MADRPNPKEQSHVERRTKRRWLTAMVIACAGLGTGSGCSVMNGVQHVVAQNDSCDEFIIGYRNSAWAAKSWHRNKHRFASQPHMKDFAEGYKQGYIDVANGGNGCTPALAPKAYWGWKYQSPEGQAKVGAWFAGYPHGARAAEEDGVGHWGEIRTMSPPSAEPQSHLPTPEMGPGHPVGLGAPGQSLIGGGAIDLSNIPRVDASQVPTVASGR